MVVQLIRNKIEAVELSKTINKKKINDIRKYMKIIEKTLNKGTSMETTRRTFDIGKKQLFALEDEQVQITNNRDEVIKVPGEFYRKLYNSDDRQTKDSSLETMKILVPCLSTSWIKKTVKGMSRCKAGGADSL